MLFILSIMLIFVLNYSPPVIETKYYDMSNVKIVFTSHDTINSMWKLLGGLKKHKKVGAFAYYEEKSDTYFIMLPYNANDELLGHEIRHVLDWMDIEKNNRLGNDEGVDKKF